MTPEELRTLLLPFYAASSSEAEQLLRYLVLLQRWNRVTNLTSIRSEVEIVQRHFGESLFAAAAVATSATDLLDIGSGAGFPGLPIALVRPDTRVTLAESQGKKAAFLRESTLR